MKIQNSNQTFLSRVTDAVIPDRVQTVAKAVVMPLYLGTAFGSIGAVVVGTLGVLGGPVGMIAGAVVGGALGAKTGLQLGAALGAAMLQEKN